MGCRKVENGDEEEKHIELQAEKQEKKNGEMEGQMVIAWWNGGGKIAPRLNANSGLQKYMSTGPDIFAYGEALAKRRTSERNLLGYNMILHKPQTESNRRGLVVYYKQKHAWTITKDDSSKMFDIL